MIKTIRILNDNILEILENHFRGNPEFKLELSARDADIYADSATYRKDKIQKVYVLCDKPEELSDSFFYGKIQKVANDFSYVSGFTVSHLKPFDTTEEREKRINEADALVFVHNFNVGSAAYYFTHIYNTPYFTSFAKDKIIFDYFYG